MKNIILFEASDGRRFRDKESCLSYEMRLNGVYLFDEYFNPIGDVDDAKYLYIKDINGIKYLNTLENIDIAIDTSGAYIKILNKFRSIDSRLDEFHKLKNNVTSKMDELYKIKESVENALYI